MSFVPHELLVINVQFTFKLSELFTRSKEQLHSVDIAQVSGSMQRGAMFLILGKNKVGQKGLKLCIFL